MRNTHSRGSKVRRGQGAAGAARTAAKPRPAGEAAEPGRGDIYEAVTARIVAELEAGRVPWVQPWGSVNCAGVGLPRNALTGRNYSGINVLILWGSVIEHGFPVQGWLTFRQALGLGGNVRKRELG